MKKNLRSMLEIFEPDSPQCLVDMNQYDLIEGSGMTPDLAHKKSAHMTGAWNFGKASRICIPMGESDLSGVRYLTFSVFSVGGAGGSFRLMFDNSADGDGKNGYEALLRITKDGWNDYRLELPFLHGVRQPAGWNRIRSITLDCRAGSQENSPRTTLYIDSFYVRESFAAPLYASMPELKGAALFSTTGNFSIIDRKRIANSPDGADAKPFADENGTLWLPLGSVAAGIAHSAVVDNRAMTLSFTYRRRKYRFDRKSDQMLVDGEPMALGFFPAERAGNLFFPADFVRSFFHWRQMYTDPMGLIVLSNRRGIFSRGKDEATVWQLIADMTFLRPDGARMLGDLHRRFPNPGRGRLLFSYEELMQLRRDARENEMLGAYLKSLKQHYGKGGDAFKTAPVPAAASGEEPPVLSGMLAEAADRILAFSTLYRMTGDKTYSERAAAECEALAEVRDWCSVIPSALGNTTLAVALCYDWCHHVWSESRKAVIERALLRNAMRPGLEFYDGKRRMWIPGGTAGAVVNAGMLSAALALADIYPETSQRLLDRILRNTEPCFASYAPDGGYAEGIEAWEKSYRSLVLMIAMLEKACGTDYGLASMPGFAASAYFPFRAGTENGIWNYHNCAETLVDTSVLAAEARISGDPVPAWLHRRQLSSGIRRVRPFDLLFYTPMLLTEAPQLPLDAVYRKAGIAAMRSGWERDAAFLGLHGGCNHEWNGDLDAGAFLLEMGGERFFLDTGGREELPLILRRRAEGQNTFAVNPPPSPAPDQRPEATAPLTEMRSRADHVYAVVDMTSTNENLVRAKRGAMLTANRTVAVVQDELVLKKPTDVVWNAYTAAKVNILCGGKSAKLEQNGKILLCRLGGVGQARFAAEPMEGSALTRLSVRVSGKEKIRLSMACTLFTEDMTAAQKLYEGKPISTWGEL